jgi:ArsR family transcriptional regulator
VKELIATAKAFADPTRVRILAALRERELCVCELCGSLAVSQSTLSTHLQVIRDAGLVSARKQGKWMYYAIAPSAGRMVDSLFGLFSRSLKADATLQRDAKKLTWRLSLRNDGACCVGFGKSKTTSKENPPSGCLKKSPRTTNSPNDPSSFLARSTAPGEKSIAATDQPRIS